MKFRENPFGLSTVVSCGKTDRQDRRDKSNSRLSQFCECPQKCDSLTEKFRRCFICLRSLRNMQCAIL